MSPGGSMTGGSFRNNSNLLGRRREIEELEKSVQGLAKELREIQQELEEKKNKRNEIRDLRTELNEKLQRQYIEQNTVRLNLEKAREKKTEIRLDFEALQKESLEIENQIAEIERNRKVIGQEMQESVERESTLQENIQKAQEALTGLRRREAEYTKDLEEIRLNYANLSQKDGFLAQNIRRLEEETGKLEAESRTMLEKAAEEKDDIKKKQQDIVEIQKTIAAAVQAKEEEDCRIVELQEKKEALSADHKEFFEKRDQLSDQISLMDKECFRLNSQKEKLEETKEAQTSYLWEEYEVTPGHAREFQMEEIPERSELKRRVLEVKDAIRKLGSVNVNAIEEYKEISERHAFLDAQHTDLVKAAETLQGIIDELDAGMRKQFTEKFEEIRKEFDRVFRQLFGGGKGTLEARGGHGCARGGHPHHLPAAGKETAEYDAALWRRESADRDCTAFCNSELEAVPLLSARRDRGGARRFKRNAFCAVSAQADKKYPVHRHYPQARYDDGSRSPVWHHDAGEGCFYPCFC